MSKKKSLSRLLFPLENYDEKLAKRGGKIDFRRVE
jgi:hypothetical protein